MIENLGVRKIGESYFDLLNRVTEKLDVVRCGQSVHAQAFQIAADGVADHFPRLVKGIAFGHQARQSQTSGNLAALFSRFKKYSVTAFGHSPVPIVDWRRTTPKSKRDWERLA